MPPRAAGKQNVIRNDGWNLREDEVAVVNIVRNAYIPGELYMAVTADNRWRVLTPDLDGDVVDYLEDMLALEGERHQEMHASGPAVANPSLRYAQSAIMASPGNMSLVWWKGMPDIVRTGLFRRRGRIH